MPRPRKLRCVRRHPVAAFYKPNGIPMRQLKSVTLPVEGLEALRLSDAEGLDHRDAAVLMEVSRPTFSRILADARRSTAQAITNGWALHIEGGAYRIESEKETTSKPNDSNSKEPIMEKIAVSCEGPSLDEPVDPRFGRAAGFIIVDPDTMAFDYLDNGVSQAMNRGAGIQAAEIVGRSGAKVVLSGYVGPKAFKTLEAVGIKVCQDLDNMTVREAVERYKTGQVEAAQEPNSPGHPA
ncbi:MAG: hypothetical protein DSY90_14340 [Deltaproteobacteria bacterium]|nr:MAG: hypothetical protein DSY90_14340 [Deltaproteobacteria bacterium]